MEHIKPSNSFELKFWTMVIRLMEEDGILMKTAGLIKRVVHTKAGLLIFLFFVLSMIGFLSGLILGRVFLFFNNIPKKYANWKEKALFFSAFDRNQSTKWGNIWSITSWSQVGGFTPLIRVNALDDQFCHWEKESTRSDRDFQLQAFRHRYRPQNSRPDQDRAHQNGSAFVSGIRCWN